MATTFRCRLITPDAQVFDDPATAAVLPVWDGQMGFLPMRSAFVGEMGVGELRVDFPDRGNAKGGSRSFFVADGFVQMLNNELTILAAHAVAAENLTESDAQAELADATRKADQNLKGPAGEKAIALKRRAEAKLAVARKFRASGAI
jgi:F-type H+-transporting ATPase subunit epsilon